MAFASLSAMAEVYEHGGLGDRKPERVAAAHYRLAHLQRTDPRGAWVALDGAEVVGVSLALRRGSMWFLSLLAVATTHQAQGIGRRLLDASLGTAEGSQVAWILASPDPRALRRYALAGFAPHPGYAAMGPLDRSLIPAGLDVRDGSWAADADLVEGVVTGLRGAPYGPDRAAMQAVGSPVLIAEDGAERGFAVLRPYGGVVSLGATSPALASRLLWRALAEDPADSVTVEWLTAQQQWAIDVALAARLALLAGPSVCLRAGAAPMTPYLPGGAYG